MRGPVAFVARPGRVLCVRSPPAPGLLGASVRPSRLIAPHCTGAGPRSAHSRLMGLG